MFIKSLVGLMLLCCSITLHTQVPEVELVTATFNDPFMPATYSRVKAEENPQHRLRTEQLVAPDFRGQFISLVRSKDRILHHRLFAQFGNIEIYKDKELLHYGIAVQYDREEKLDKFLENIIEPRTNQYRILYFKKGKPTKASKTFYKS